MKKLILFALAVLFAAAAMGQSKVAVYVEKSPDSKVTRYVEGELVKYISRKRNFRAVNRSESFAQALQKERGYEQSGMVDNRQIAALGKESGVDYVCAVVITGEGRFNSYRVDARLIDVTTADIYASDTRNITYSEYSSNEGKELEKMVGALTLIHSGAQKGGVLYSKGSGTYMIRNNYGDMEVVYHSDLSSVPEAYRLYSSGFDLTTHSDYKGLAATSAVIFGALGALGTYLSRNDEDGGPTFLINGSYVLAGACGAWFVAQVAMEAVGKAKIKKAIKVYNTRNGYACRSMEVSAGMMPGGVGVALHF